MNQCLHFQNFGHKTAMIGAIGNDSKGEQILKLLNKKKVNTSHLHIRNGVTASNQMIVDEQGERHGIEGAWSGGVYEEYQHTTEDWDFLKLFDLWSTHANAPVYLEALKRKQKNQFLAVDFLHFQDYELLELSLGILDIAYFGGTHDMAEPLAKLAIKKEALIVLTLGGKGSIAFNGSERFEQPALNIEKVADTTGCGDAFQSAFTDSFIQFRNISKALHAGAENGRLTASHLGAIPW